MSRAGQRILQGAREAVAIARLHNFGPYPEGADQKKSDQPKRIAQIGEVMLQHIHRERADVIAVPQNTREPITSQKLVREGTVRWTSVEAGIVLNECRYDRQDRDLNKAGQNHIDVLAAMMTSRQWRTKDKLDFAMMPDGKLILVNGHHRLGGQQQSGATIEWTVVIHRCRSDEEVSALYYTFDTNVRTRGHHLILGVIDAAGLLGVTKSTAEALYRAAPLLMANFDFRGSARDAVAERVVDRRLELMKAYSTEAREWEVATEEALSSLKKKLSTQGALAVALVTFRHQSGIAGDFWNGVAANDGLRKGDPRQTYITSLFNPIFSSKGVSETPARLAGAAWNAWFENRTLAYIQPRMGHAFRLAGTPVGR